MATEDLDELQTAVRALASAADDLGDAANELLAGTAQTGVAHMTPVAGVTGVDGSAKVFARALQLLGRALLGIGNEASAIADIGGRQYSSKSVVGAKLAKTWSEDLVKMTSEQYRLSANSYAESLCHVGSSGSASLVGDAAHNALGAARETLKAAKSGGDAAIIELAEKAVELAQAAVEVVERAGKHGEHGASAARAALQAAGKALIVVGNAVNSKRGTDGTAGAADRST